MKDILTDLWRKRHPKDTLFLDSIEGCEIKVDDKYPEYILYIQYKSNIKPKFKYEYNIILELSKDTTYIEEILYYRLIDKPFNDQIIIDLIKTHLNFDTNSIIPFDFTTMNKNLKL